MKPRQILLWTAVFCAFCLILVIVTQNGGKEFGSKQKLNLKMFVRTSHLTYKSRLPILMKTWIYPAARISSIAVVGPTNISQILAAQQSNEIVHIDSNCLYGNKKLNQCCQLAATFSYSQDTNPDSNHWTCHFDDDSFVNVFELKNYLSQLDSTKKLYVGRNSLATPYSFKDVPNSSKSEHHFFFATGGAGICLSHPLLQSLGRSLSRDHFTRECERTGLSDDVLLGYLISRQEGVRLTISNRLHSHLEDLTLIKSNFLQNQISLSYELRRTKSNTMTFSEVSHAVIDDITGFERLSCLVYSRSNSDINCSFF